jgi:predicted RNA-binding Zn-ribbon protein involved in translation (DUF1610 family)
MQKHGKKPVTRKNRKIRLQPRGFSHRVRSRPVVRQAAPVQATNHNLELARREGEPESRVKCPKCGSLMVPERFIDYMQTGEPTFYGLRCLSCGLILDPVILIHRAQQKRDEKPISLDELLAEIGA